MIRSLPTKDILLLHSSKIIPDVQTALIELLKNSISAGSTSIELKLSDYGLDRIEIIDNGDGMDHEKLTSLMHLDQEALVASNNQNDIFQHIRNSLGYICHLSSTLTIASRTNTGPFGFCLTLKGSEKAALTQCNRQVGTTILVDNFLCNFPVRTSEWERNKFKTLKESLELIRAFAFCHFNVKFKFTNCCEKLSSSVLLDLPIRSGVKETCALLHGLALAEHLREIPRLKIDFSQANLNGVYSTASSPNRVFYIFLDKFHVRNQEVHIHCSLTNS